MSCQGFTATPDNHRKGTDAAHFVELKVGFESNPKLWLFVKCKIDMRALTRWFPLKKLPLPPQPLDISFCWGGESFGGDGVRQASDLEAAGDLATAFGL